MNRLAAVVFLCAIISANAFAAKADFYVASNGNDQWSGSLPSPNKSFSDGPFATIDRARAAVNELKSANPNRQSPVIIYIRGGYYFLNEPLIFTPNDSGTQSAPIIYSAYPGENPIISGGRRIVDWKKIDGEIWQARVPGAVAEDKYFAQLFVNGARRYRTRLPEKGYYYVKEGCDPSPKAQGKGFDRFRFNKGEINSKWYNLNDVEILPFHLWTNSRMLVGDVDDENCIVTFQGNTAANAWWSAMPKGNRYLIENVREALNKPGKWYYDRKQGIISYIPLSNENMKRAEVIIPWLDSPVQIKGDVDNRKWVSQVHFKGLSFMYGNWTMPKDGYSCSQAEFVLRGLINLDGARDCSFENCTIAHTGAYGIDLGVSCKGIRISDCEIADLGAGGIKIGDGTYRSDNDLVTSHNMVRNNLITNGGRLHPAGVGVIIGHSSYNRVIGNTISDFYYTGVDVGWSWGYGNSNANHNIIENNHIYKIGQGVLSDMGGIYTLGISDGSMLRHNLIHDVESYGYGGWGVYLDEGTTHMLVQNNIVHNTKSGGFHQHYGKENEIRNNIFAFGHDGQIIRTRNEEHLSFTFERNIVYWNAGPLLGSNWDGNQYRFDYNTYWNPNIRNIMFASWTFDEWRAKGQDIHSIIADPLFFDPIHADFRMKPNSPAFSTGFQAIDVNGFGESGVIRRIPEKLLADPAFDYSQQSNNINETFDDLQPGDSVPGLNINAESEDATISVTSEKAFSGTNSLKFTDKPGQQFTYNPHAFYLPDINHGKVTLSFNLLMEPGAVFYHEWRSMGNPYHAGPSLRVENGELIVNGRRLTEIPNGQWVTFRILADLDGNNSDRYSLEITLPDRKVLSFKDLKCDPLFVPLRWIGFVADGESNSSFYIDDIRLVQH